MVRIPECGCEIKLQIWDTAGQERYCHYTLASCNHILGQPNIKCFLH